MDSVMPGCLPVPVCLAIIDPFLVILAVEDQRRQRPDYCLSGEFRWTVLQGSPFFYIITGMSAVVFDTTHLRRTYFRLAVPGVLSMLVTLVYNFTDTYFIARTGDADLVAGVSLCLPLMTTLMAFGNIFGQGGSSVISRMLGQGDRNGSRSVSSFCFYAALLTGVVLAILFMTIRSPMLRLLGANEATFLHARDYYTVFALASPIIVVHFIHMNLVRCEGYSAQSMKGNVLGSVVNTILDPVLISGLGLGAMGAAVASVTGYLTGVVYLAVFVHRKSDALTMSLRECRIGKGDLGQVISIGITAALANLAQSFAQVLLNQSLLPYGNVEIAAMGIAGKVNMIALLVITGFSFGGVPLFGYVHGEGDKAKMKELVSFCLRFLVILSIVLTLLLVVLAPYLVRLFMEHEQIVRSGTVMIRFLSAGTVFASIALLFTVIFQATGRVIPAFVMSVGRQGVLFFAVMLVLRTVFGYYGVLSSQFVADLLSSVIAIVMYVKGQA